MASDSDDAVRDFIIRQRESRLIYSDSRHDTQTDNIFSSPQLRDRRSDAVRGRTVSSPQVRGARPATVRGAPRRGRARRVAATDPTVAAEKRKLARESTKLLRERMEEYYRHNLELSREDKKKTDEINTLKRTILRLQRADQQNFVTLHLLAKDEGELQRMLGVVKMNPHVQGSAHNGNTLVLTGRVRSVFTTYHFISDIMSVDLLLVLPSRQAPEVSFDDLRGGIVRDMDQPNDGRGRLIDEESDHRAENADYWANFVSGIEQTQTQTQTQTSLRGENDGSIATSERLIEQTENQGDQVDRRGPLIDEESDRRAENDDSLANLLRGEQTETSLRGENDGSIATSERLIEQTQNKGYQVDGQLTDEENDDFFQTDNPTMVPSENVVSNDEQFDGTFLSVDEMMAELESSFDYHNFPELEVFPLNQANLNQGHPQPEQPQGQPQQGQPQQGQPQQGQP